MTRSHRWTAADIPDQTGRSFVVTGSNTGIGLATTAALTARGARVIMACRNAEKAEAARAGLPAAARELAHVRRLDLADLDSVAEFVENADSLGPIDVLINNAGLMNIPHGLTAQGHEMQFGVNTLGHHALTAGLAPHLMDRVVWLGSIMHRFGTVDPDDLDRTRRRYSPMPVYADSKLACVMLAYEQQRRLDAAGSSLRAVAAHPGYSATDLQYRSGSRLQDLAMKAAELIPFLVQPAERGALPELYAATVPSLPGGSYVGPDGPGELTGHPKVVDSTRASHDREVAAALWKRCAEMTAQT